MAVDFTPVKPGDSTNIKADTWNSVLRSARAHALGEARRPNRPDNGPPPDSARVLLFNDTALDLDRGAVVGLGDPITPPDESELEFVDRCGLIGVVPTSDHVGGRFAITAEAIPIGGVGFGIVAGLAPCKVQPLESGETDWANPIVGETGHLEGAASGVPVIWIATPAEGDDGPQWAVLMLGGGAGQRAVRDVYYLAASSGNVAGIYKEFTDEPVGTRHLVKGTTKGYCPSSGSSGSCDLTGYDPGDGWSSTTASGYPCAYRNTAATSPPAAPPEGTWEDAGYPTDAGWVYVWRTYSPCNCIAYGYDPNLIT